MKRRHAIGIVAVLLVGGFLLSGNRYQRIVNAFKSNSYSHSSSYSDNAYSSTTATSAASSVSVSGNSVSVYFPRAGGDAEGALISQINSASKKLDVAIYSFTDENIADAIANAKKRGVSVRMMTDRESAGEQYQEKCLDIVKNAGITIKDNTHSGIMHLKVSIIDSGTVTTGSFNYTKSAQNTNDENLVIIHNTQLNSQYEVEFNRMWNDTSDYADWNG